ncbi:MAG: hypothetical protein BGO07_04765 [Alphaproteobacteria bacterium 40-19]|nr:MAG: hypothetical protein BGO07_04765 [Alphaproteobacteria bacterium 40-19]
MFQKSILAALFMFPFWASPGWSTFPQENPGNLSETMKEFYKWSYFPPSQDLNKSEEGGIFFSPGNFTEEIKGPSYSAKEKQLEMLKKRWARHAIDAYYSIRDEEMAKKKYHNPQMTAKLSALPRNLHTAVMRWEEWDALLKSQEVFSLPSWCYIVVIDTEKNIKNEEEANRFLNQLLPRLLARNLIHLEVVWNLLYNGVSRLPDPSGDCSLVLSGKALTEAFRKVESARRTYLSNFAEKIEELYSGIHSKNTEYQILQGSLDHLKEEIAEKEKKSNIKDYPDIMWKQLMISNKTLRGQELSEHEKFTPKEEQIFNQLLENQEELENLKKEYKKQEDDLFDKQSALADSEIELGKEFYKKVKEMTFSSHISHQDHATQVCEDDFKPEEVTSAVNKEENPYCNILRLKESNPPLTCSTIDQEIRKKSALIQQLKSLIEQQENILEQQKKDLENLINGSCSYLVAADKESQETFPNNSDPTTPKSTRLSPKYILTDQ